MTLLAKIGAFCFGLWGLLHLVGGAAILIALRSGSQAGFELYRSSDVIVSPLAGAVLGYLAFALMCAGAAVCVIAVTRNWKNSMGGLAANTLVAGSTETGLILFLLLPGYVPLAEALPGMVLLTVAVSVGGFACRSEHARSAPV